MSKWLPWGLVLVLAGVVGWLGIPSAAPAEPPKRWALSVYRPTNDGSSTVYLMNRAPMSLGMKWKLPTGVECEARPTDAIAYIYCANTFGALRDGSSLSIGGTTMEVFLTPQ